VKILYLPYPLAALLLGETLLSFCIMEHDEGCWAGESLVFVVTVTEYLGRSGTPLLSGDYLWWRQVPDVLVTRCLVLCNTLTLWLGMARYLETIC
jgi:hypothetical protein